MTNSSSPSARPYLLRAMHDWMTDNSQTPLVIVDAQLPDVLVPEEHIKEGRIVLNIAWSATRNLEMTNELVSFDARFSGVAQSVSFPTEAVIGIYARETGQGMQFGEEEPMGAGSKVEDEADSTPPDGDDSGPTRGGPKLRLVK